MVLRRAKQNQITFGCMYRLLRSFFPFPLNAFQTATLALAKESIRHLLRTRWTIFFRNRSLPFMVKHG